MFVIACCCFMSYSIRLLYPNQANMTKYVKTLINITKKLSLFKCLHMIVHDTMIGCSIENGSVFENGIPCALHADMLVMSLRAKTTQKHHKHKQ